MTNPQFIRVAALVAVLVALVAHPVAAAMEPGDFKSAHARAVAEDKPLIIDFYTDW